MKKIKWKVPRLNSESNLRNCFIFCTYLSLFIQTPLLMLEWLYPIDGSPQIFVLLMLAPFVGWATCIYATPKAYRGLVIGISLLLAILWFSSIYLESSILQIIATLILQIIGIPLLICTAPAVFTGFFAPFILFMLGFKEE